jgi:hypothetical protein
MGMMVVLIDDANDAPAMDASTANRLSDLGVTNVAVMREGDTMAFVLDGWAFDPGYSAAAVRTIFGSSRALLPVLRSVLTPDVAVQER